jgi:photosystem II stability/assembly factor-like uncharacterized protein
MLRLIFRLGICAFIVGTIAIAQTGSWAPTNGPWGGQIRAAAISPDGPYFAVAWQNSGRSRLYRSTDHGESYQELTAGDSISFLGPLFCGGGGLVLCGAAQLSGQTALARSTDDGDSWTTIAPPMEVTSFAVDSSGMIMCGAFSNFGTQNGVFISSDGGATWSAINGDLTYYKISGVSFGRDSSLFVSNQGYNGSGTGVYRSTDGGTHWTNVFPNPVNMTAIITTRAGSILAGSAGAGVVRSTNNGQTWPPVSQGAPNISVNGFSVDSSGSILMCSSSGIYRSTDDGASWILSSEGLANLRTWSAASGPGEVELVGNQMGLFRSLDGGKTWTEASRGIRSTLCSFISVNSAGTLVATTHAEGGVYRSADAGLTWSPVGGDLRYRTVYGLAAARNGTLFACVQADSNGEAVFRSTDQGMSWEGLNTSMPNLGALNIATRGDSEVVVVGNAGNSSTGVFRSTDNGSSWNALTTGYTNLTFSSVALPPDGKILAGYYGGVAVSSDTGRTWQTIDYGLPFSTVKSLASNARSMVFAATDGFGVYYLTSDVFGPGWAPADSGLPFGGSAGFRYLTADSAGNILGASENVGVWQIPSGNVIWSQFANGLADTNVTAVCISPSGTAFATTYDDGVFSTLSLPSVPAVTNLTAMREGPTSVRLTWSTIDDSPFYGFEVQRWIAGSLRFASISEGVIMAGNPAGQTHDYLFEDTTATTADEQYRLRIIGQDGSEHYSDSVQVGTFSSVSPRGLPLTDRLDQNYPNPFNPTTVVRYQLSAVSDVKLVLYDILGRQVTTLINRKQQPGAYSLRFDGSHLASGVYFYRLTAGSFVAVKRMLLIK